MNAPAASEVELWLEVVRRQAGAMRFGSVQVTVHDGRVTQVEAIEKVRLATPPREPDRAEPARP